MTPDAPTPPPPSLAAVSLVIYTVLGGGAAAMGWLIWDLNVLVPYPGREDDPTVNLMLGVALGLMIVVISRVLDRRFAVWRKLTRLLKSLLGELTGTEIAVLAFASSVGEELLFRGLLLPKLGIVASSVIFGVVHGLSPGSPREMLDGMKRFAPLVIAATCVGFAFAWSVEYTGNIFAAVVAHFTINFLNLSHLNRLSFDVDPGDGGNTGDGRRTR